MRHVLSPVTFLAVAFRLALPALAAGPVPYDIPLMKDIRVDGDANDWADGGFRVEALAGMNGEVKEPTDLAASFRLGWDGRGLLVLVNVRDNAFVEGNALSELSRGDCVELYLADARGGKELVEVVVAPGVAADQPQPRWFVHDYRQSKELKKMPATATIARAKVHGGYVAEVLLPWEMLGIRAEPNREVGFQISVGDMDPNGELFRAVWYPQGSILRNTTGMQRLRLSDHPSPPVRAAARVQYEGVGIVRLRAVGGGEVAGKPMALRVGGKDVDGGKFTCGGGSAIAEATLFLPSSETLAVPPQVLAAGACVALVDQPILAMPALAENEALFGARVQRTMTLLATSSAQRRQPVRILFYGQSITVGAWTKMLEAELRRRYRPAAPDPKDRTAWQEYCSRVNLTTLASGLANAPHVLEIVPNGDGPVPIEEVHVHRPPLH